MKTVSLFLVCAIVTLTSCDLTPEMREHLFKVQNECMQETGATDEMVLNSMAGKFSDDPELAQQFVCVGKRGGMLDDAGHFHKEPLKSVMLMCLGDEAKIDAVLDKCLVEKATIQASAIEAAKCVFAEMQA